MVDWTWFWMIAESGVAYALYRWYKSDNEYAAQLETASDIDINHLKELPYSQKSIDFAAIHGIVQSKKDWKSNLVITSQFLPDSVGVIQRIIVREKKLEKFRSVWAETFKTISDNTRYVPFRLATSSGNYVQIDKPLTFDLIQDQLDVTKVNFEPNTTSSVQKIVETFLGELSTGIETKEQMLLINTPLTGIGRLEKQADNVWRLVPHEKWGGVLTRSTRTELIAEYHDRSYVVRIISICFGLAALGTAAYLFYKYYSKRQRRTNRLPNIVNPIERTEIDNNQNARLTCVICLENEIIYSLQPCSHLGLCHTCAQTLQTRSRQEELCPICRTPIENYQRIFLP